MVAPLYAGWVLRVINDPATGVRGYNIGDGIFEDAIENLGLQVGVDYEAARPDLWDRPADDAPKAAWVNYAAAQGMDRDAADNASRSELVARYPRSDSDPVPLPRPARPGAGAHKADWVAYAVSEGMDRNAAEGMTIAALADEYAPAAEPEE